MPTKTKTSAKKKNTGAAAKKASVARKKPAVKAKAPTKKKPATSRASASKKTATPARASTRKPATKAKATPTKKSAPKKKTNAKSITQIVVHYDVGFENHLYIRGKGARLSWEKGKVLKNTGHDTWVWETSNKFPACEFKILVNDQEYEEGDNHMIQQGNRLEFTPDFPSWGK